MASPTVAPRGTPCSSCRTTTEPWSGGTTTRFYLDPAIDYVVTTPGDYYVRVTRVNDADVGTAPYLLSYDASAYAVAVPASANTTAASAMHLSYGQTVSTAFAASTGGQQFFVFDGDAGDVVRLWIDDKSSLQGSQLQMDPSAVQTPCSSAPTASPRSRRRPSPSPASRRRRASSTSVRPSCRRAARTTCAFSSPAGGSFGIRLERIAAAGSATGWISGVLPLPSAAAPIPAKHHTVHAEEGQLVTLSLLAGAAASQNSASPFGNWGSPLLPTVQVVQVLDATHRNTLSTTSADRLGHTNYAESMLRPQAMLETSFRAPAAGRLRRRRLGRKQPRRTGVLLCAPGLEEPVIGTLSRIAILGALAVMLAATAPAASGAEQRPAAAGKARRVTLQPLFDTQKRFKPKKPVLLRFRVQDSASGASLRLEDVSFLCEETEPAGDRRRRAQAGERVRSGFHAGGSRTVRGGRDGSRCTRGLDRPHPSRRRRGLGWPHRARARGRCRDQAPIEGQSQIGGSLR